MDMVRKQEPWEQVFLPRDTVVAELKMTDTLIEAANACRMFPVSCVPDSARSAVHIWSHLILLNNPWHRFYYYYSHYADEETRTGRLSKLPKMLFLPSPMPKRHPKCLSTLSWNWTPSELWSLRGWGEEAWDRDSDCMSHSGMVEYSHVRAVFIYFCLYREHHPVECMASKTPKAVWACGKTLIPAFKWSVPVGLWPFQSQQQTAITMGLEQLWWEYKWTWFKYQGHDNFGNGYKPNNLILAMPNYGVLIKTS